MEQIAISMEENGIQIGTLTVVTKEDDEIPFTIENGQVVSRSRMAARQEQSGVLTMIWEVRSRLKR